MIKFNQQNQPGTQRVAKPPKAAQHPLQWTWLRHLERGTGLAWIVSGRLNSPAPPRH
jgi:hypothetical protein